MYKFLLVLNRPGVYFIFHQVFFNFLFFRTFYRVGLPYITESRRVLVYFGIVQQLVFYGIDV